MAAPAQSPPATTRCRVCGGSVERFLDLGRQPLSDVFRSPQDDTEEFFYRLHVGQCGSCSMVQLMEEVPRERMFHADYPYFSSGSSVMREHFAGTARGFLETELTGNDPLIVEIGSNDGVMLSTVRDAGVRHVGFEPSGSVAAVARGAGIRVQEEFFEATTAEALRLEEGPADVIFAANTFCHIPYIDSVLKGVDALLGPDGVFVFEDPYFGDIVSRTSFDQIYDEHFFLFSATSVRAMVARHGLELVDVRRLPVHGGEVRYTIARAGARPVSDAVTALIAEEEERGLHSPDTLRAFAGSVASVRNGLIALLERIVAEGGTVDAYGATAKSATVVNYAGLGPGLIRRVYDSTPAKQGMLTPGAHIPVVPPAALREDPPGHLLLFAWNHAEEIMEKERWFREQGGRWILYVPEPHTV